MPPDPLNPPKRTKAERQAALAARRTARPVRDHPSKGKPKPQANIGGRISKAAALRNPTDAPIAVLDPTDKLWRITGPVDPNAEGGPASAYITLTPPPLP